jgi:serine/threonine-protein kinase
MMKKNFLIDTAIGLLLTILVVGFFYFQVPFFERTEMGLYDLRAKLRQDPQIGKRGDEVVIVAIDDDSINKIGRWPWPRSRVSEMITQLTAYEPKVIGLNILFSEPEGNQGLEEIRNLSGAYGALLLQKKIKEPKDYSFLTELSSAEVRLDNDTKLISAIQESQKVLLAMSFGLGGPPPAQENNGEEMPFALVKSSVPAAENAASESLFPPAEASEVGLPLNEFAEGSLGAGHVTLIPDEDGVMRRETPLIKFYGQVYPSFALQAVRAYLGVPMEEVKYRWGKDIRIGKLSVPLDGQNRMALSYAGGAGTFPYYSFYDVANQKVQGSVFKNKIVLIAFTASGLGSLYVTPVAHNYPGVEYIATVIQNVLHNNFIVRPEWGFWAELGSILFIGLFVTFILPRMKAGWGLLAALVLGVAIVAPAVSMFVKQGYWIRIAYPFFLLVLGYIVVISKKFFTTEKKKELVEASEIETNKMLGLSFQGQGQLDLAFEKFRKCPVDDALKDTLYNLGLDFERKRQFNKAVAVYEYISKTDAKFKDIAGKIDQLKKASEGAVFGGLGGKAAAGGGTVMMDSANAKPTLGRYEIVKELGRGAMGVVYLGKDPKINRMMAIKTMMFDDQVDEKTLKELKERFFREAESAGNLSHPNIVRIFDAGEDQDMAYIAMELMEGEDLKNYSTSDKLLPMPKVIDYIAKVADALDYAHQQGVTHRDIKPANIMLLKDGTVRVADFGIARMQGSTKTATGTVLGTPSYMSPEQVAGKKVDGRSDLFSLGVTLYELLTGEKPFKGGDAIGTLLFQIANDPHTDPRTVRADIPEDVVAVINKALVKDPEKRYSRGGEMAQDLRACLAKLGGA